MPDHPMPGPSRRSSSTFAASDPTRRRRPAGRHPDAREHGLPSAVGVTAITVQDTPGVEGVLADRRRLGRRPGALRARGHAGRRVQDRRARQRREHRGDRRGRLRLSRRSAGARSGARLRPRRRARQRRHDARDARAAGAADHDPHAEQPGGAPPRRATTTTRTPIARRVRAAPDRRAAASTCWSPARTRTRRRSSTRSTARTAWCAPTAGSACRAAITARAARSPRRSPRRSRNGLDIARRRARSAGIHVADARSRRSGPGMGQYLPDRLFWAREDAERAPKTPTTEVHRRDRARQRADAPARALRGHARHATTPRASSRRCDGRASPAARRSSSTATRARRRRCAASRRARCATLCARARRAVHRQRRRRRSRARSMPTACTSARDDGDIAPRARVARPRQIDRRVLLRRSRSRATRRSRAGADYVAFGSFFASRDQARRACARRSSCSRGAARRSACRSSAIGGITADNARALIAAGADAVAVISASSTRRDVAQRAARALRALFARRTRRRSHA